MNILARAVAIVVALAIASAPSGAQVGRTTFAFDVSLGGGSGRGGELFRRDIDTEELALSIRRLSTRGIGFYAAVGVNRLAGPDSYVAVCYLNSRGGCQGVFPHFFGPIGVIGLIARPVDHVEVRLGAGAAAYRSDTTNVGAMLTEMDIGWFPASHFGLVAGGRLTVIPDFQGDRLSALPWVIGIRLR